MEPNQEALSSTPPTLETSDRREAGKKPYATPRLTEYGSLMTLTAGPGPSEVPTSDRNLKEGFAPVDPREILAQVLALPIERWSYKGEPARHLGPMAQDFAAAFGLGADDRHIFPLDASGVALAAIQGLHALVRAQDVRLRVLERALASQSGAPPDAPAADTPPETRKGYAQPMLTAYGRVPALTLDAGSPVSDQ